MLRSVVAACQDRLVICSPWISPGGVAKLEEFLSHNDRVRRLEIWARFAEVTTDSRGILRLAQILPDRGVSVKLRDSELLHLKVYLADDKLALFGSANLTESGFTRNPELVVSTGDPALLRQVISVLENVALDDVALAELAEFISTQLPELERQSADRPRITVIPPWRGKRIPSRQRTSRSGTGRRAFLIGADPGSGWVREIVKIADWGQRSINIYDLVDGTRKRKIYPAAEEIVKLYEATGVEIEEPYLREDSVDQWISYGRETATRLGYKIGG